MKLPRRTFLHLAVGAAALPAVSRIARAQAYPSRPVRIGRDWIPNSSVSRARPTPCPSWVKSGDHRVCVAGSSYLLASCLMNPMM
jgi:hypothetical protein